MRALKYFFVSCMLTMLFGLFVNTAFAADYYWRFSWSTIQYPSAQSACESEVSSVTELVSVTFNSGGMVAYCNMRRKSDGFQSQISVQRYGDSCPAGTAYNATTGACDVQDQCLAKSSTSSPFSKSGTAPDAYVDLSALNGKPMGIPSTEGCFEGCAASTADQKCTVRVDGQYRCAGMAWFTGQQCSTTGTGSEFVPEDTLVEPDPQTVFTDTPCVYVTQPDGTQRCESERSTEVEGQHCGTVNGVQKCISAPPSKEGVDISTTVDTQANADGSTTTTKTDTATKTSCSGVNSCTSTTTTTTTTTHKGSNGETTSSTSSCTGEDCAKDVGDDQDGDGMDDCQIGGNCEDEFSAPEREGDEPPGFGDAASAFMDRLGASPLLSSVTAISVPSGGSCNFPEANTPIGTISMDSMCDLASTLDGLHAVFLAVWGLAAIRVFMSA